MYIMGISGWSERGHDASACLIKNNKLIAFAEEERFIRKKHSFDTLPHNAISFCLKRAGITVEDIDYLAIYWDFPYHFKLRKMKWNLNEKKIVEIIFPKEFFKYKKYPKVKFINHHLSHASSVFRCSNFGESLILVVDGQGEKFSTTLWYGKGNEIEFLKGWGIENSLGYFYEAVCKYVGLEPSEPGKLMGLSAYGKPNYSKIFFKKEKNGYTSSIGKIEPKYMDEEIIARYKWENFLKNRVGRIIPPIIEFKKEFSRNIKVLPQLNRKMKDLASSAQATIEDIILHLIEIGMKMKNTKNICIAGGVGLNCLCNGKILESKNSTNIFVQPASYDSGCSIGAALELYASLGYKAKFKLDHVYYGPQFSNNEILKTIKECGVEYEYYDDISGIGAEILAKNKIIGWFQGKMEFGPRALGNRSILANSSNPKMKDIINKRVKHREWFRPFAPTIIDKYRDEYLDSSVYSPFMLFTFHVKNEKQKDIPAVVHVDGTTRPQTLKKRINPLYYNLIREFESQVSIPLVLNTSFNTRGEPIVCNPLDAIKTFYSSGLDYLIMGNYIIKKR